MISIIADFSVLRSKVLARYFCCVCLTSQLEQLIEKNYYLNRSAKDAYRSYLQAYASHSLKNVSMVHAALLIPGQIFEVNSLDLQRVAKAFGFTAPPSVNLGE